jgi:hypothetical protein
MMIVGSFFFATLFAATLNIEVQQPVDDEKAAEIVAWVQSTADTLKHAYGRFPNPAARIVVIPSTENAWGSDSPVLYGRVTRTNGETVELFVNPDRPIEEFYEDWTATHEFSHLMLPLLSQRYRWISEGFATYYQNILMARAERYTPEFAWQRLTEGFERGRESRPELSLNDAAAGGIRHARMKVYWSGAAIALMADITLRERSNGTESLDSVLGQLQLCCLPAKRRWSGPQLFKKLDTFIETPVFMPLYNKYANNDGFPDIAQLLSDLGVSTRSDGTIALENGTSLADIREAISAAQ